MKATCGIAGFLGCLAGVLGACGAGTAESEPTSAADVATVAVVPVSETEEPRVETPGATDPAEPTPTEPSSLPPEPAPASTAGEKDLLAAREQFQRGVRAYQEGRYEDAKEAFEGAYSLAPKTQVLYNLAMVELRLGNRDAACRHIRSYEANGGVDPNAGAQRLADFQFCFSP